jgi:hypothetical protein
LKNIETKVECLAQLQIALKFTKEQTGASGDEQGVYGNEKEKELESLFAVVEAESGDFGESNVTVFTPANVPANVNPLAADVTDTVDYDITEEEV